ncbi:MAG: chemotaxis protein CheW [Pirellulales bacterium]|nr:chemotaxis protein CheW [Pirellulales bacterium]
MIDRQIVEEFVVESRDHLVDIESQLLAIEAGGANIDDELVNTVFRAVHSIKGTAGFLQLSNIQALSHEMENVLNMIRNRQLVPRPDVTTVLFKAADTLRAMVENVDRSEEVDVSGHISDLQAVITRQQSDADILVKQQSGMDETANVEKALDLVDAYVSEEARYGEAEPVSANPPSIETTETYEANETSNALTAAETSAQNGSATDANIRVSVRVLDHLMNLAGELVLARNQLLQTVATNSRENLDSISARLNQVTSEIQEAVMQTRLQAVETVFRKFPRLVRDLCQSLDKQCDLVVEGKDVELDKSIIEAIGDPLTHLIRNAVDHGLESPEIRTANGKNAKGKIFLKAFHQAGKVHLVVKDDGAGINAASLRDKAVAKGVITSEQAHEMSARESLRLIFRPGLSTAKTVSNLSGRGVGMDVVKTNIEKLGGTVDVESTVDEGTSVNITLPLTLAIIPSLIVRSNGRRFAIPQASISELVRVKAAERAERLQYVDNAEVLRLRGALLPLVRLNSVLENGADETDAANRSNNINIIVVEYGLLRYGVIVDALHDSEEIVVKPLGKHMKDCRCFAGATILGDGQVALIVDVAGLASQVSLHTRDAKELAGEVESTAAAAADNQTMLLFTNAETEQFAVPMGLISRLERIRSDQIDKVGGQEVLQYRGVSLPLLSLENHINALPRPEQERLYVIVYRIGQREIGLIAPQLTDIRQMSTDIDTTTFQEKGVIGSLVLDNKATRMLDLLELTRSAHAEWIQDIPAEGERVGDAPTILLAEDSSFFRKQLAGFLQAEGYNVLACEDGKVAWDVLCHPGKPCDLIVTDLEMPNLNGFDLAQRVRNTPSLTHIPIIAVTSLASDEDVERGKIVGIDDYHIKLDRERLVATVADYLHAAARTS